jgi:hypothetical protein
MGRNFLKDMTLEESIAHNETQQYWRQFYRTYSLDPVSKILDEYMKRFKSLVMSETADEGRAAWNAFFCPPEETKDWCDEQYARVWQEGPRIDRAALYYGVSKHLQFRAKKIHEPMRAIRDLAGELRHPWSPSHLSAIALEFNARRDGYMVEWIGPNGEDLIDEAKKINARIIKKAIKEEAKARKAIERIRKAQAKCLATGVMAR